ncbi:hypothetical protein ACQ86K_12730 [Mucilaginibacter sp. P19]
MIKVAEASSQSNFSRFLSDIAGVVNKLFMSGDLNINEVNAS